MKIAVDARPLLPPLTGIGRYTLELLKYLVLSDHHWYLYCSAPIKYAFLERSNVSVHVIPAARFISGISTIVSQVLFPYWVKRHGVDLFWAPRHHLPLLLPSCIPTVLTIHDLVWMRAPTTMTFKGRCLERLLMPLSIKKANAIVPVSNSTLDAVANEFSISRERMLVIYPGAEKADVGIRDATLEHIAISGSYFLFVGTIEPRKNLERLLQAYSNLADEVKNRALFVIAGRQGWGGCDLDNMIGLLGLRRHVVITGYVNEKTLAMLYANTMFLAMPSLYEGFGIPLVEAMKFGKPVLTSNNSSMPEVSGDAGFLVDPLDVDSITYGLTQMIENTDLRCKLAENAEKNASRFNWHESAAELISLFEKSVINTTKQ